MGTKTTNINQNDNQKISLLRQNIALLNNLSEEQIKKKIYLYEELFKLDISQEKEIVQYLLLYRDLLSINEAYKPIFIKKLDMYNHFISEKNYLQFFEQYSRKNAFSKIFSLLNIIMSDLDDDITFRKRKNFIKMINEISEDEVPLENYKKSIEWKDKEIYLYNLYIQLLSSLNQKINYRKKITNINVTSTPLYKSYIKKLDSETSELEKEKIKNKMELLNLFEGEFFQSYIKYFKLFLLNIIKNLNLKFKDNKLEDTESQLLFEDFIQFLSNYEFVGKENKLIYAWNEAFVPLNFEEKK